MYVCDLLHPPPSIYYYHKNRMDWWLHERVSLCCWWRLHDTCIHKDSASATAKLGTRWRVYFLKPNASMHRLIPSPHSHFWKNTYFPFQYAPTEMSLKLSKGRQIATTILFALCFFLSRQRINYTPMDLEITSQKWGYTVGGRGGGRGVRYSTDAENCILESISI